MLNRTVLKLNYTPPDAFDAAYQRAGPGYQLAIEGGTAALTFEEEVSFERIALFPFEQAIRLAIEALETVSHRRVQVSGSALYQYDGEGHHSVRVYLESPADISKGADQVDTIQRDATGTVIYDSKADRIRRHQRFVDGVLRHAADDVVLRMLLHSYTAAVTDPANEFFYLYEIRDALKTKLGGDNDAREKLGFDKKSEWAYFGQLTSHWPLDQGRHRGIHINGTRPAIAEELRKARELARKMIERYIDYLDGNEEG